MCHTRLLSVHLHSGIIDWKVDALHRIACGQRLERMVIVCIPCALWACNPELYFFAIIPFPTGIDLRITKVRRNRIDMLGCIHHNRLGYRRSLRIGGCHLNVRYSTSGSIYFTQIQEIFKRQLISHSGRPSGTIIKLCPDFRIVGTG
ncbi:hypothetical protein D3C74_386170 [compost metagenome]